MIIETKYKIGDSFWVPRVREVLVEDVIIVDGKEYKHSEWVLTPFTKQLVVGRIFINIEEDEVKIEYRRKGDYLALIVDKRMFATEQEALDFATNWVNEKKKVYYGSEDE
jgi:hypothetical protein